MTETLYLLFFLAVLGLIAVCVRYLFDTRSRDGAEPASASSASLKEAFKEAETLSGTYSLSDLGTILAQVASLEAWGAIVEIELTTVSGVAKRMVRGDEVRLDE